MTKLDRVALVMGFDWGMGETVTERASSVLTQLERYGLFLMATKRLPRLDNWRDQMHGLTDSGAIRGGGAARSRSIARPLEP